MFPGVADIVSVPRLFPPLLRLANPEVVVMAKVELLKVTPEEDAVACGVQPVPKHPSVDPATNTSSARAVR
jgi:hypothetical protein